MSTSIHFNAFDAFTQTILERVQVKLGEDYKVLVEKVTKNNGMVLTGLIAKRKGNSVYPTIYIDNLYKKDMTEEELQETAEELCGRIQEAALEEKVDLSGFTDFSKAREQLAFKLIHAEKNKEFLKEVPHRRFHNLAIVFYYTVQESPFCGNAVIVIKKEHMKKWKVSTEELYQTAIANMPLKLPAVIQNMEDVMRSLLESGLREDILHLQGGEDISELFSEDWISELLDQMTGSFQSDQEKIPMYVLSNKQKLQGAACILYPGVLKKFSEKIKHDFYVLPSSVHEVILVPAIDETGPESLRDIVTDINRTQVAAEEVLSDSVYFYSRKRDSLEWIC